MREKEFKALPDGPKRWLRKYFYEEKYSVALVVFLNFIGVAFSLIQPYPLKLLADSVFGHNSAFWPINHIADKTILLYIAAISIFVIAIMAGLYSMGSGLIQQRIEMRLNLRVQRELLAAILDTPLRIHKRLNGGEYQYRLNNLAFSISEYTYSTLITIIRSFVLMGAMSTILLLINPLLAVMALIVMPLIYFNVRAFAIKFEHQSEGLTEQQNKIYNIVNDITTHTGLIQANNGELASIERFTQATTTRNRLSIRYALTTTFFSSLNDGITNLATAGIILAGGFLVFSGRITFGDLLVFITYMGMLFAPLQELSKAISSYKQEMVEVGFLFEIIDTSAKYAVRGGTVTSAPSYGITYTRVNVRHEDQLILDDISFVLPAGKKLGIIGPSGAGKSTLLDIIPRFIAPEKGQIKIGGVGLYEWDTHALRSKVAIVDQRPQIIEGTILANILYGSGHTENEAILPEVMKAVAGANALKFIESLPMKFDTLLGTNGVELSLGQAQRICLARAIMKNAPILLLDEPTSALDEGSRKEVIEAIKREMLGRTVLVVTHDYSLLQAVNYIVALKNGKLVPITTSQELSNFITYLELEAKSPDRIGNLSLRQL